MSDDKLKQLARTVELDASYNGHDMHAYMVPGMCGLRSFHGFDGNYRSIPKKQPNPSDIVLGIVLSGISGCVMVLTAIDKAGSERAQLFKAFVEGEGIGAVTVTPGTKNKYTGRLITTMVFEYDVATLAGWAAKTLGKGSWNKPDGWHSATDKVHMDTWFYNSGGRPKNEDQVTVSTKPTPNYYKVNGGK